jgi:hypothetical protein
MNRNLKLIVGVIAALGTTAANASEFPFDDPYWKRAETVHAFPTEKRDAPAASTTQSKGPYDLVDNYNP